MADILSVALRALSFILLLQAAGVALFVAIFAGCLTSAAAGVRRIGRASALLAIAAVVGDYLLKAGRMAGDLSGIADASLQGIVLHSASAAEAALRLLGLLLVFAGLGSVTGPPSATGSPSEGGPSSTSGLALTTGIVGATIAAVSFTLVGHTAVSPERVFLIVALAAHVLIVAFWLGALPSLYLATVRESREAAAQLLAAFSATATWIVPGIFLAGAVLAVGLVRRLATFEQPYGELLLVKIGAFAVLMALAAMNKWRLAPALARGEPGAVAVLRRSVAAEYVLIVGVLTATAVMTTFFSPE